MKPNSTGAALASRSTVLACGVCALALIAGSQASAQVQKTAGADASVATVTIIAPAMRISPSNVPLEVVQPTSTVPTGFLRNNIIPLASLDDIVKFQPSVWSQNPNGPGIGKAETLSLRGFQDGQFNVTFDGIPFGDATDLHHTTSAMFIAHDLGQAEVDRGPGTASTIGKATFGGTIGFRSKDVDPVMGLDGYGTIGSFNTHAYGGEIDTGKTQFGGAFVDIQHEDTDGYLTGSAERRNNIFAKYQFEIAPKTSLTVVGSYNHEFQYTTQGATLAQYAKNGDNYGLCSDKTLQCYYGYQPSNYYSDFEYAQLKTEFGWLKIDETLYTNAFTHKYVESKDASDDNPADNGVTFYSPTKIGTKVATFATDIPGKATSAHFRSIGDILRLSAETPIGELRGGAWYDNQSDHRYSYANDLSQPGSPAVPSKTGSAYSYIISDGAVTWQPYAELDLKPIEGLEIIPGVKYTAFDRRENAPLNKNTKLPASLNESFNAWQPSVSANYRINSGWSVYAQAAKGFLAPPIDVFEVSKVASLSPETTWNFQAGTALRGSRWMFGADAYYIDFSNYLTQTNVPGTTDTTFINGGGAVYKGFEVEGQYAVGMGFSAYANFSVTDARYKHTDVILAEAPEWLAAGGILYDNRTGPYFSLIGKLVGPHYGVDNTVNGAGVAVFANAVRVDTVFTADLAGGWRFTNSDGPLKNLTASIKVGNLFDNHAVSDYAGDAANGAPLYWRVAGRSVFFNLEAKVF